MAEIAIEALEKKREIEKELEKYRGKVRHRTQLSELSEGLKNRLGEYQADQDLILFDVAVEKHAFNTTRVQLVTVGPKVSYSHAS